MRLIDVDALIDKHCEGCNEDVRAICKTDPVCATLMWFEEAPTIDAVPVVRCKDCKHWNIRKGNDPAQHYFCNFDNMWIKPCRAPNDFCSYGEQRKNDEAK